MPRSSTSTIHPSKKARFATAKKTPAKKRATAAVSGLVKVPGRSIPLRLQNKMRFTKMVEIAVVGGIGNYGFSCNGLTSPDVTVTGQKPLYFDQLMELYTHYAVQSSTITVQGLVNSVGYSIILSVDDDNVFASAQRMLMQGQSTHTIVAPQGATKAVRKSWNRSKAYGVGAMEGAQLTGTVSANPTEQNFYRISIDDPSQNTFTLYCQVVWEADVIFNELKTVVSDA